MTFGQRLFRQITENWDDFLKRIYEEKAQADLDALVNDEAVMEKFAREIEELPWQPYPVPNRVRSEIEE